MPVSLRSKIGCWMNERWRAEAAMMPLVSRMLGIRWQDLHNRNERTQRDPITNGLVCDFADTQPLTINRIFPQVGTRLFHHVFGHNPLRFARKINEQPNPKISFIVGIRGLGRLPQFISCIESIMGQEACPIEVIVVEQSWQQQVPSHLGDGVRYQYSKPPAQDTKYNRSWALNVGARAARGEILVLQDADFVLPANFAHSVAKLFETGIQACRL
ncbi:MAG: glycosyltransferase family A protein, partial [Planctomycetota bacterium]